MTIKKSNEKTAIREFENITVEEDDSDVMKKRRRNQTNEDTK